MKHFLSAITAVFCMIALTACHKDTPDPVPPTASRTLLIYMVATNNLSSNAELDLSEIMEGTGHDDVDKNSRTLVYLRAYYNKPALVEVKRDSITGVVDVITLKTYSASPVSTEPQRISEVVADMQRYAPADDYGLVLWSHALNWEPSKYWFGTDNGDKPADALAAHCDIPALASAIPDQLFSFIWADCCYMGSIEVAWELRSKCSTFVAYPTEVMGTGCPYQLIIPCLMKRGTPDITGAAQKFFDHYDSQYGIYRSATIAVISTENLSAVAQAARVILSAPAENASLEGVLNYARKDSGPTVPYYDFKGYMQRMSASSDAYLNFCNALDMAIIYKAATPKFYNTITIPREDFSGLSVHHFTDDSSATNNYYKTLAWHNAIYQ